MTYYAVQLSDYVPQTPEMMLWATCLEQAIEDATQKPRCSKYVSHVINLTRQWFASNKQSAGSFLWICDWLDLEPELIRAFVKGERKAARDMSYIRNAVRTFRKENHISQIEFAKMVGTNSSRISNIERGKSPEHTLPEEFRIRLWEVIKEGGYENNNFAYQ